MIRTFFILFITIILLNSCEEIINEENISNDTIQLLAPTDATTLPTEEKIVFSWQSLAGADSYTLQIARPNFSAAIQIELDSTISTTSFSIDSLKANDYEWRIKGLNSAFETVYSSNAFTVEKP